MQKAIWIAGILICALAVLCLPAFAQGQDQVITLQQEVNGYTGCSDTYLESATSSDYKNFGIDNDPSDWTKYRNLEVRNYSNNNWVSLVKFDLSSLPRNWNITSASFSMYAYDDIYMGPSSWLDVAIYPLKKSWTEGVGPHTGDNRTGAAWYYQYAAPDSTQWYNGGARGDNQDRDHDYDGVQRVYGDPSTWVTWGGTDVTQTVRDWYSGARANDGWQIDFTGSSDSDNGLYFHNSEYSISPADYMWRPKLDLTYQVVPEPATMFSLVPELAGLAFAIRRRRA